MSINIMNIYILTFLYILNDSWFRQFPHRDWPVMIVKKNPFSFWTNVFANIHRVYVYCVLCSFVPKINFWITFCNQNTLIYRRCHWNQITEALAKNILSLSRCHINLSHRWLWFVLKLFTCTVWNQSESGKAALA